jgi:hypothetical protein
MINAVSIPGQKFVKDTRTAFLENRNIVISRIYPETREIYPRNREILFTAKRLKGHKFRLILAGSIFL